MSQTLVRPLMTPTLPEPRYRRNPPTPYRYLRERSLQTTWTRHRRLTPAHGRCHCPEDSPVSYRHCPCYLSQKSTLKMMISNDPYQNRNTSSTTFIKCVRRHTTTPLQRTMIKLTIIEDDVLATRWEHYYTGERAIFRPFVPFGTQNKGNA